jgi:hypothetical protein
MPPALPDSLAELLSLLRPVFTTPSFDTFCWLVHGFIGRIGEHTVTGIWQAARLAGVIHHSRAHDFFARRRWSPEGLGLLVAELVVRRFIDLDAPIRVAVDDTLFARAGRKVFAAGWHFDGAAPRGATRLLRFGNSFVCLGIIVPLGGRVVCLPLLFALWRPAAGRAAAVSRVELAHRLIACFAERFSGRRVEVCADAYYANRGLRKLPANVSACVRLRANASLRALPPNTPRSGPGRPRLRGEPLGSVRELAADPDARWQRLQVRDKRLEAITIDCLWYRTLGTRPVRVVIARDPLQRNQPPLAVLCTDPTANATRILSRYIDRWAIEVAFAEAKGQLGVGETRNRVRPAVERSVPFGFLCRALVIIWYELHGDPENDVARHRTNAPWYRHKHTPSFADMLIALRRELIRAEFMRARHRRPPAQQNTTPPTPATATRP